MGVNQKIGSYAVKPTKYAPHICTGVTIVALIGIIVGLLTGNALWPVILLLPAAFYEAYRTGGKSTKASSILLVLILILEIFLILFNVNFNLVEFLGTTEKSIGGYWVPLGDIKVVGPTAMAVLSVILFTRTRGKFTKWLAVTIFITSFAIVYTIDPDIFSELFKYALNEGLNRM
jgi:hypothetical protein